MANNANLILKINILSQDGQSRTDYHTVTNTNATGPVIIPDKAAPVGQPGENPNHISEKLQLESEIVELTEFKMYPNPSDGNFSIAYTLDKQAEVSIKLFDSTGKFVKLLHKKELSAGFYSNNYCLQELNDGLYLVEILLGNENETKQLIILK